MEAVQHTFPFLDTSGLMPAMFATDPQPLNPAYPLNNQPSLDFGFEFAQDNQSFEDIFGPAWENQAQKQGGLNTIDDALNEFDWNTVGTGNHWLNEPVVKAGDGAPAQGNIDATLFQNTPKQALGTQPSTLLDYPGTHGQPMSLHKEQYHAPVPFSTQVNHVNYTGMGQFSGMPPQKYSHENQGFVANYAANGHGPTVDIPSWLQSTQMNHLSQDMGGGLMGGSFAHPHEGNGSYGGGMGTGMGGQFNDTDIPTLLPVKPHTYELGGGGVQQWLFSASNVGSANSINQHGARQPSQTYETQRRIQPYTYEHTLFGHQQQQKNDLNIPDQYYPAFAEPTLTLPPSGRYQGRALETGDAEAKPKRTKNKRRRQQSENVAPYPQDGMTRPRGRPGRKNRVQVDGSLKPMDNLHQLFSVPAQSKQDGQDHVWEGERPIAESSQGYSTGYEQQQRVFGLPFDFMKPSIKVEAPNNGNAQAGKSLLFAPFNPMAVTVVSSQRREQQQQVFGLPLNSSKVDAQTIESPVNPVVPWEVSSRRRERPNELKDLRHAIRMGHPYTWHNDTRTLHTQHVYCEWRTAENEPCYARKDNGDDLLAHCQAAHGVIACKTVKHEAVQCFWGECKAVMDKGSLDRHIRETHLRHKRLPRVRGKK